MKFFESIVKDNRWSFIALLKVEIDGCKLTESSKSFQIFTALWAKDRCPEAVLKSGILRLLRLHVNLP